MRILDLYFDFVAWTEKNPQKAIWAAAALIVFALVI